MALTPVYMLNYIIQFNLVKLIQLVILCIAEATWHSPVRETFCFRDSILSHLDQLSSLCNLLASLSFIRLRTRRYRATHQKLSTMHLVRLL